MPAAPRMKKMQKLLNDILGKPEAMQHAKRTEKQEEVYKKLNYQETRLIR